MIDVPIVKPWDMDGQQRRADLKERERAAEVQAAELEHLIKANWDRGEVTYTTPAWLGDNWHELSSKGYQIEGDYSGILLSNPPQTRYTIRWRERST